MIVYVETNFLLELAYRQEKCDSCEEILDLARSRLITLALPAFSAAEARVTWHRRRQTAGEFHSQLEKYIREIARSEPFRGLVEESKHVVATLLAALKQPETSLEGAIQDVQNHGLHLPLTGEIVTAARWAALAFSLRPEDAIVLESIMSHAKKETGPKCFVSRDPKAFAVPEIRDYLSKVDCKVLSDFPDAAAYIRKALPPPP